MKKKVRIIMNERLIGSSIIDTATGKEIPGICNVIIKAPLSGEVTAEISTIAPDVDVTCEAEILDNLTVKKEG